MTFRKYGYKLLVKVGAEIYELMKAANNDATANEFYFWNDMYLAIQAEIDRRVVGEAGEKLNEDIRRLIDDMKLKHYEIAAELGIDNCTLSKWLRVELSADRRQRIIEAITKLTEKEGQG